MAGFYPHGPVGITLLVLTVVLAIILVALLVVCGLLCKYGYFTSPFASSDYQVIDKKDEYVVVETVKKKVQPNKNDPVDMHIYSAKLDELMKTTSNDEIQMLTLDDEATTANSPSLLKSKGTRKPRPDSGVPYFGLGRIVFQLRYSVPEEYLYVYLLYGRQISQPNGELAAWPVVKVNLNGNRETEKQSPPDESPNPEYDQEFSFGLKEQEIGLSYVMFTVWDTDMHEQKTLIGHIKVSLANFVSSLDGPEGTGPLGREITGHISETSDRFFAGELLLSLSYSPSLDRMMVSVLRAVNLIPAENATVIYAKIFFTMSDEIVYSKKTSSVKESANPIFNSNVLLDQLTDNDTTDINKLGLIISVRAKTSDRKKFILGQVALGNFRHAKEDGVLHWNETIESPNYSVAQWHKLIIRQ